MKKEILSSDINKKKVSENPTLEEQRDPGLPEKVRAKQLADLAEIYGRIQQGKQDLLAELFLQGGEHAVLCEIFGDPDHYNSPKELNEAIDSGEIIPWWMGTRFDADKFFEKIDSKILEKIIVASNKSIFEIRRMLRADGYEKMMENEEIKKNGEPDPIDRRTYERYMEEIGEAEKTVRQAERVRSLQENFEKQLDRLSAGEKGNGFSDSEEGTEAGLLFRKYQEIVSQTRNIKKEFEALTQGRREIDGREIEKVADSILEKASQFLGEFSFRLKEADDSEAERLLRDLDNFQADLTLSAGVSRKLLKEGVRLSEMAGFDFERLSIKDLTGGGRIMKAVSEIYGQKESAYLSDIDNVDLEKNLVALQKQETIGELDLKRVRQIVQMLEIYKKNFRDRPELQQELLTGFADILKQGKADDSIYLLSRNSKIMGFIRYDRLDEKTKQVASFNIAVSVQNMSIGGALFLESSAEEAKNSEINGVCDGFSLANVFYVEKAGFFVDRIDLGEIEKNKFPDFYIKKNQTEEFLFKGMAPKEIEQEFNKQKVFTGGQGSDRLVKKIGKGNRGDLDGLAELVNRESFAITRMIEQNDCFYCALEKTSLGLSDSRLKLAA